MIDRQRIALLIDADGMSLEVIGGAIELIKTRHGAIHIRRCYCSADFATKNLAFLREHGIRAMVNATSGKNCTDIALAIDAVELCGDEAPGVVVIVASDSDFAPLVIHLRERGCRVEGVGQAGKTGAETPRIYDEFVDLPQGRRALAGAGSAARPARVPAPAKTPVASSPANPRQAANPRPTAAERPAALTRPAAPPARAAAVNRSGSSASRPAAPAPRAASPLPEDLAAWLDEIPALASGQPVELSVAAEALRRAGLLSKGASSTKLFRKYPDELVLLPASRPNSVQYRRGRASNNRP